MIDQQTADAHTAKYPLGEKINEGKTKAVYEVRGKPDLVLLVAKHDITAGDGAKRDVIEGKAMLATQTTCNVFQLLEYYQVPLAFHDLDNVNSFVAEKCTMLPYEVVVRGEAYGSYLKRVPMVEKGRRFDPLLVEFFLKTSGRKFGSHELPCDDPLMIPGKDGIELYRPDQPFKEQQPFAVLPLDEVLRFPNEFDWYDKMAYEARDVFGILQRAWSLQNGRLIDLKLEFGITSDSRLVIADVIDNDSWRVIVNDKHVDKQAYRDGASIDEVTANYRWVAEITERFLL